MLRSLMAAALACALVASPALAATDYTAELTKLSELASAGNYRAAIDGYRRLQARPGAPVWLKSASEYEIAELYGALGQDGAAIEALDRSVQLGYDDCLSPEASARLAKALKDPRAPEVLGRMKIAAADLHELAWLKREVENAEHDARMMIADNVSRVDQQPTEIPQVAIPTRATTSPAVLYWRQQLLLMQAAQRSFVKASDEERMVHAATMGIVAGGSAPAIAASARAAQASADARRAEVRQRAFTPVATPSGPSKPCSAWRENSR